MGERELVRLVYNDEGKPTLGKVVVEGARRVGPPVTAYWEGNSEEVDMGGQPTISIQWIPTEGFNAYATAAGISPMEVLIEHPRVRVAFKTHIPDKTRYNVSIRRWTSVQFYKIPERYFEGRGQE